MIVLSNTIAKQNGKKRFISMNNESLCFFIAISPWLIGYICFQLAPMLVALVTSFSSWDGIGYPIFNGIQNYKSIFEDEQFLNSLWITAKYTVFAVPTSLIFALLLAQILSKKLPGCSVFQALFYFPSIVSGVAVFITWNYLLDPKSGVINYLLSYIGISGPPWLSSPDWALPSLIFMNLFFCGGQMLIFIAGINQVPEQLYEAGRIDGANEFHIFFKLVIPELAPIILFNLIMGIISSVQVFAQAFVMTSGGPARSTYFLVYYLYEVAFKFNDFGYASSMSLVMFLLLLVLNVIVLKFFNMNSDQPKTKVGVNK